MKPSNRLVSPGASEPSQKPERVEIRVRRLFESHTLDFLLILGVVLLLLALGVVMVFSSLTVNSIANGGSSFSGLIRQLPLVIVGIPLALLVARIPRRSWGVMAPYLYGAVIIGLLLVFTSLGEEAYGNRNWLMLGPVSVQPSEFLKMTMVIWLAVQYQRLAGRLHDLKQVFGPIFVVPGFGIALVALGKDMGTVVILCMIWFFAAIFGGLPFRTLMFTLLAGGLAVILLILTNPSRLSRISTFLSDDCDYWDGCWQIIHASYALASGGLFGTGLGSSKAKWNWLPAAENDFIFAVIAEELGLIGAGLVIALFLLLGIFMFRVLRKRKGDHFAAVAVGAIAGGLLIQAFINIAVVIQLFPVMGVTLPFISAGGTSLLATMASVGVVLGLARHERVPLTDRIVSTR